jgi:hypothetical protein
LDRNGENPTLTLKIISLGWGVQSFTLAAMVALGELEPIDFAIHADTTHEASGTYDFARRWTPWLEERGVRVVTVKNTKSITEHRPNWRHDNVDIPAYTVTDKGNGQIHRQCTGHWKIEPMRRYIQSVRNGEPVEQWIGISLDEYQRMKDSDVKYITHRWPLIEKKIMRKGCEKWLSENGIEIPSKSSCTFCPFHNSDLWRVIKNNPVDWAEAVAVDKQIRKAMPPYDLFVHPSRNPLDEVDLRTEQEKGQLSLWDEECSGICGV